MSINIDTNKGRSSSSTSGSGSGSIGSSSIGSTGGVDSGGNVGTNVIDNFSVDTNVTQTEVQCIITFPRLNIVDTPTGQEISAVIVANLLGAFWLTAIYPLQKSGMKGRPKFNANDKAFKEAIDKAYQFLIYSKLHDDKTMAEFMRSVASGELINKLNQL